MVCARVCTSAINGGVTVDVVLEVGGVYSMDVIHGYTDIMHPSNAVMDHVRDTSTQLDLIAADNQWPSTGECVFA